MVARTTPAWRAISAMLASGSLASASRAASMIWATLRSASARRRGLVTGEGSLWVISVDRHRAGGQPQARQGALWRRQANPRNQAGDTRDGAGGHVSIAESAGEVAGRTSRQTTSPASDGRG